MSSMRFAQNRLGVGDQGLGFGEFQFEMLAQELSDSGLDFLSF